jgi:hypothetical protein
MKISALTPRHYLVGVFDVVGLSNIFQSGSQAANAEALRETVGFTHWVRTTFKTLFDGYAMEKNRLAPYDRDLRKIETLLGETDVKLQAFADAIIPFTELPEAHHQLRALSAILRMFHAAGSVCVLALAGGRAIRGGLAAGDAVERAPLEIYGPALNDALALEMRWADYPRIAIGTSLRAYLKQISQTNDRTVFAETAKTLAARCAQLIIDDQDGQPMLHYLSSDFRTPALAPAVFSQAQTFIAEQKSFWASTGQPHLAERYQRLYNYWQRYGSAA